MSLIRDSIIIFFLSMLTLAGAETGLRMIFPDKVEKQFDESKLAYKYDKDAIIALKPNIEKKFIQSKANGGQEITWRTNSHGYRGPEIGAKEDFRIVVYGDSNVQARFSDYADTYPAALQKQLQSKVQNVVVVNGGLVGAGPDQSLLRFVNDYDKLKPDMIVLHIFADNDYGDIVRNRLFELDKNSNLIRTAFQIKRDQQISEDKPSFKNFVNSLLLTRALLKLFADDKNKLSRDERIKMVMEQLEKKSASEYLNYSNGGEKSISHFADHYDIDIATEPGGEAAQAKVMLMKKILELAKAETDKRKVRMIVVIQPAAFDMISQNSIVAREDLNNYKNYNYKNLTNPMKEICESINLYCMHLIDEFENKKDPAVLYLKEDNHWSNKGQELSARITSDYILQYELYK